MNEANWHNCDGKIGARLRYVSRPTEIFNENKPTWAFHLFYNDWLAIKFCPICGEELEPPNLKIKTTANVLCDFELSQKDANEDSST